MGVQHRNLKFKGDYILERTPFMDYRDCDRPALTEITPEMEAAGAAAILDFAGERFPPDWLLAGPLARNVFKAMLAVSLQDL
jgi:hypothetical protein